MNAEFLPALLSIIVIDLVVSGDNAVVIGMAAHRLPPQQRRLAHPVRRWCRDRPPSGAHVGCDVAPDPSIPEGHRRIAARGDRLQAPEGRRGRRRGVKVAVTLKSAITTILIADFIMSLDNILAVAAAAKGNIPLLLFGLVFSMAVVMVGRRARRQPHQPLLVARLPGTRNHRVRRRGDDPRGPADRACHGDDPAD